MGVDSIIEENRRRNAERRKPYDPLTGDGSDALPRTEVHIDGAPLSVMWLPEGFVQTGFVRTLIDVGFDRYISLFTHQTPTDSLRNALWTAFCQERVKYDFEFCACQCFTIESKEEGRDIPFVLRSAQRYYLKELEKLRLAGKPIDIILLKARQWGGSTLTQLYMLWIQLFHHVNWHSVICGDVESQSNTVAGMLSKVVNNFPVWATNGVKMETSPFERSSKTRIINTTQSRYSIGSAQKPDSLRSQNIKMAHLTEVGLWQETKGKKPEDLVQAIFGSIYSGPDTMKVLESTAKGVGNYFHRTWLDAVKGKNNFTPVFVPWFMIDMYSLFIDQTQYYRFLDSMTDYEHRLFELGATLENIAWYREKKKEFKEEWRFMSEYPSTPEEAFQSTGRRKFPTDYVNSLRQTCTDPVRTGEWEADERKGDGALSNLHFVDRTSPDGDNILRVWFEPDKSVDCANQYVVSVDVGGLSSTADYSCIRVANRLPMTEVGGVPEIVAEWHGHIEHDLLAWKAVQIAEAYNHALLVIESNTMETEGTEGDHFEYVLDEIVQYYDNLYSRTSPEQIRQGMPVRYGFHTNTSTKPTIIDHLLAAMRDGLYLERSEDATFEMDTYEIKDNGKEMGAKEGCHDDYVMATAILIYVCYRMDAPYIYQKSEKWYYHKTIISEASL